MSMTVEEACDILNEHGFLGWSCWEPETDDEETGALRADSDDYISHPIAIAEGLLVRDQYDALRLALEPFIKEARFIEECRLDDSYNGKIPVKSWRALLESLKEF